MPTPQFPEDKQDEQDEQDQTHARSLPPSDAGSNVNVSLPPRRPLPTSYLLSDQSRPAPRYSLYVNLLALNQEAFHEGLYATAYHALLAALHGAKEQQDMVALGLIERMANDQLNWLELNAPRHWLVSPLPDPLESKSPYRLLMDLAAFVQQWYKRKQQREQQQAPMLDRLADLTRDQSSGDDDELSW